MPGLIATGTLSYNGYPFDGATKIHVDCSPVRDEANRTVIYVEHELTVEATVANIYAGTSASTDDTMRDLRARLTADGGPLIFKDKGFGDDLVVNVAGNPLRDVKYGPKPQMVSWVPIGNDLAAEVVWKVKVCVPVCKTLQVSSDNLMAANYSASYSIDQHGDTTRVISGYIEVRSPRVSEVGKIQYTVDEFRETALRAIPVGFQRISQSFNISQDKTRLDYSFTDQEIATPNPWPANVTEIEGNHHIAWRRNSAAQLENSLTMRVSPRKGITRTQALQMFLEVLGKRRKASENGFMDDPDMPSKKRKAWTCLTSFEMDDGLFVRSASFSATYRLCCHLKYILEASGMFTPLGADWKKWHTSVEIDYSTRGHAGLTEQASLDTVVNLCGTETFGNENPPDEPSRTSRDRPSGAAESRAAALTNTKPAADASWFDYKASVTVLPSQSITQQKALRRAYYPETSKNRDATDFTFPVNTASGGAKDVIQQSSGRVVEVIFTGEAVRAGYRIPRPFVESIGGVPAREKRGTFSTRPVGNYGGVIIYKAKWAIRYVLDGEPTQAVIPPPKLDEGIFPDNRN